VTDEMVGLYDPATGDEVADTERDKDGHLRTLKTADGWFAYADEHIFALEPHDGDLRVVAEDVDLEGESPTRFEQNEEGYLLATTQMVMRFTPDWEVAARAYAKPPGRSVLTRAKGIGFGVAAGLMQAQVMHGEAEGWSWSDVPALLSQGVALSQGQMMNLSYMQNENDRVAARFFGDLSRSGFRLAQQRRSRASQVTEEYLYVLAKKAEADGERGEGLLKIRMRDAEVVGQVVLDDKKPTYVVDPVESRLYHLVDDNTVRSFDL
jgi:hypothetical protein